MDDTEQRRIAAGNDIDLKWLRSFVVVAGKPHGRKCRGWAGIERVLGLSSRVRTVAVAARLRLRLCRWAVRLR